MTNAGDLLKTLPGWFTIPEVQAMVADGDNTTFSIVFAGIEKVGQGTQAEDKPVLKFGETPKGLVLNKTRANALAALFGTDDLVGKRITLGVEAINSRDQVVVTAPQ